VLLLPPPAFHPRKWQCQPREHNFLGNRSGAAICALMSTRPKQIADETIKNMDELVNRSIERINKVIDCTPQVLSAAIERSISNIKLLGLFTLNYKSPEALSPAAQYFAARDVILNTLKKMSETTNVEDVVASYGEISRLAQLAQCHYKNK